MKKAAVLSSKNQITIPAAVRALLGLKAGETVVFDVDVAESAVRVTLHRYPTLAQLADSVPNPPDVAGRSWEDIRTRAWIPERVEQR